MINKSRKKINKFLFLIILSSINFNILSDEVTLVVKGVGDSKANAIIDAQRNALRTSYGEFVSNNLTTLDNELTKNETVNLVSGTIKESKVLSESLNDFSIPPITEVLMEITVNKGKLVSFAKAIGDNVEIQGSLFGAELKQQEINKENERVAMEHLVEKAKTMAAFFDYNLEVGSPKKLSNTNFYLIKQKLILTTNKNYLNLLESIENTMLEISMSKAERDKYDELNVEYHPVFITDIQNSKCINSKGADDYYYLGYRDDAGERLIEPDERLKLIKNSNIDTPSFPLYQEAYPHLDSQCGVGMRKFIFLRSNPENALASIRQIINESIMNYDLYRDSNNDSYRLYPKPFDTDEPGSESGRVGGYTTSFLDGGIRGLGGDFILNKVRRWQPNDKEIVLEVEPRSQYYLFSYEYPDFFTKDNEFTRFAKEVHRTYGGMRRNYDDGYYESTPIIVRILTEKGGYFSDPEYATPFGYKEFTVDMFGNPNIWGNNSGSELEYTYSESEGFYNGCNERRCLKGLLKFHLGYEFSRLSFDDVVSLDELSSITNYSVSPDKLTKR